MDVERPLMTRNASSREAMKRKNKDAGDNMTAEEWREIAHALWQIIDDIDTLIDIYKPDMTAYAKSVDKKVRQRFGHLQSDGYILFLPEGDS